MGGPEGAAAIRLSCFSDLGVYDREPKRTWAIGERRRLYEYSRSHPAGLEELYRRLVDSGRTQASPNLVGYVPVISDADSRASIGSAVETFRPVVETISRERVQLWPDGEAAGGAHLVIFTLWLKSTTEVALEAMAAVPVFSRVLLGGRPRRSWNGVATEP